MTILADSRPAVTPVATAGLLLAARSSLADLGLASPGVAEILGATGASRSRAYEVRDDLLSLLSTLVRPPGRPRVEPVPPADERTVTLTRKALAFVMDHPGCVYGGPKRRHYSDEFRHRVIELRGEWADLDLETFAAAVCVPAGTLEDWLRPGGAAGHTRKPPAGPRADDASSSEAKVAAIETVLDAWRKWSGSFAAFCSHIRHHQRIRHGNTLIADILFTHGERTPQRRGRRHTDEDALRGTFETFFPGAQWVGDGAEVVVTLDDERFSFNLELMVDPFSGAFVGASIRDREDSEAVVEAFAHGIETTAERPIALLLDNRPSNHTAEVTDVLEETLCIPATLYRAQNKAHVEGAFGLFAQHAPPIHLPTDDRRELGRQVLALVATLFARIVNHRPRRDRKGKSRFELSDSSHVTEVDREEARRAFLERIRQQERARRTREARLDPGTKRLLDEAFQRLGLDDPKRHFRNAIACYRVEDIVDSIAIFEAKSERDSLPEGADARYLLGIVRNVHHVHEADAITLVLLRRRLQARDTFLQPLVQQRDAILDHDDAPLRTLLDRALDADRTLDHLFWIQVAADFIVAQPEADWPELFRQAARRIHATFAVPTRKRSATERRLARLLWPIS